MLQLSSVTKRFGHRVVLHAVSLEVAAGEYVAVVGESGVGKSTLLNIVAGLEPPDAGEVSFRNAKLTAMDDDARTLLRREKFGFVFQAFHVLPHLTVQQNVGLPLLLRGLDTDQIQVKSKKLIAAVGLAGRESSMPRELSGGELQHSPPVRFRCEHIAIRRRCWTAIRFVLQTAIARMQSEIGDA